MRRRMRDEANAAPAPPKSLKAAYRDGVICRGVPDGIGISQAPRYSGLMLGRHGDELLREHLGGTDSQIADLRAERIFFSENR